MSDYSEINGLLSRYFEGTISQEELAQLESKLLADADFAQHVSRWCLMHRQVADLLAEKALHELMDGFVTGSPAPPPEIRNKSAGSVTASNARGRERLWEKRSYVLWFGCAAVAALILAAAVAVWTDDGATRSPQESLSAPDFADASDELPQRVGTLTQLIDAEWMADAPQFHHGEQLYAGNRIALKSGMAKVTFDCGAEIVLEGPCDFVAQEPMVGYLKSGKITADVPRRAFAFAILSPKVDFVDLGTSFGLNIGEKGDTELHVFQGEVLCSRSAQDDKERGTVYHVTEQNAVEFLRAGDGPNDIAIDQQQFTGHISLRRGNNSQTGRMPGNSLALWLAADSGVTTDDAQRVISWQDILYGDNQSGEDAIQVDEAARPRLVDDALTGRPAIRFDGNSDYLLTTPLATTDDQTVAFVCQFSESATTKSRRWGGQILNYDGPPNRYLSDTLEPGVLQIGEPLLEQQFKPTLLTAQVFAGFIGSATVESGRIDGEAVGISSPVVVTYRYDLTNSRATFSINGKHFSETRAFAPQAITSRKIIGRHAWMQNFFHGDLAELLIFNRAISSEELAQTTRYLADKYAVKIEDLADSQTTQTSP